MVYASDFEADFELAFYDGGAISDVVPRLFPVGMAGHGYMIDLREEAGYQRTTLPFLRQATDQGSEAGEQSLNPEGLWRRAQGDWNHGAGQATFDRQGSDRQRFHSSKGIYIWEDGEISLMPATTQVDASVATNQKLMLAGDVAYYWIDGTDLYRSTSATAAPSAMTGTPGGSLLDMATDGTYVYVCDGASTYRGLLSGTSVASWSTVDADTIGYANGRLFISDANVVKELDAAGAASTIYTHNNPSFVWRKFVAAPNGTYIFGDAGGVCEVYYVGVDTDGSLSEPVIATTLQVNEVLNDLIFNAGLWHLATNKGVRTGLPASANGFGIDYGELIEIGDVPALVADGNYVWFSWSDFDATSTGIGRFAPGIPTTAPTTPAYASDLMVTGQGEVSGVISFEDIRIFCVQGLGLYRQHSTDLVTSGWLRGSWLTYGLTENKTIINIGVQHYQLEGTFIVSLVYDDVTTEAGTSAIQGSHQTTITPPTRAVSRAAVLVTLTQDSATAGPKIKEWVTRALPAGTRMDEIIVPIVLGVSETVGDGDGADYPYDTLEEFRFLKNLEREQQIFVYQEGEEYTTVRIDKIQVRPWSWTDGNRWFNCLVIVRLLTLES